MTDVLIDLNAERAVVGSLLLQPSLASRVFSRLMPSDLTAAHALVLTAINDLQRAGAHVDVVTVTQRLTDTGQLARTGGPGYLSELLTAPIVPMAIDTYLQPVLMMVKRRKLQTAATRLLQAAESDTAEHDVAALEAIAALDMAIVSGVIDDAESPSAEDLLAVPDAPPHWVIPGLIEHGERFMLTAGEGGGKSTWMRQMAVCAAAGIHPFTGEDTIPMRVLVVDCENSLRQTRRKIKPLVELAANLDHPVDGRLRFQVRPDGLDLTKPPQAAWLMQRVTTDRPDLLIIGPLYRLLLGRDVSDDLTAAQVAAAIDAARIKADCAVMIEAHAGHGQTWSKERDLRPKGSSFWRAWPEAIRGLRPETDDDPEIMRVEFAGRLDRDERYWPTRVKRGGAGEWPWQPTADSQPADYYAKFSRRSA